MDVEHALDLFVIQLEADGRSPHTVRQYQRHVRALARWAAQERVCCDVAKLGHADVASQQAIFCTLDETASAVSSTWHVHEALRESVRMVDG